MKTLPFDRRFGFHRDVVELNSWDNVRLPMGYMVLYMVCHGSHQYTPFMLALIYQHHGSYGLCTCEMSMCISISALDVDNVDKVCTELHCGVLKLLVCRDDDLRWQLALVSTCQHLSALVSTCQHLSAKLKTPSSKPQDLRKNLVFFVGQIFIVSWSHPYMLGSHHPSLWRAFFLSIAMVDAHTNQQETVKCPAKNHQFNHYIP